MDFQVFSGQYFKTGIDYHPRIFHVIQKNNEKIVLVNILTGEVLFDNLELSDITISGAAITNFVQLQEVVFNKSCHCELENTLPTPFKYFDLSFDENFE